MALNQDFKEFIELLNARSVRYMVIGGYAVAFHGHPRYTKDLDVWVDATPKNAELLIEVLEQFGFGGVGISAADFVEPDRFIVLGKEPTRIDIITSIKGLSFDEAYKSRIESSFDGVIVNFISREHLIVVKKAAGRLQDLADVENLSAE